MNVVPFPKHGAKQVRPITEARLAQIATLEAALDAALADLYRDLPYSNRGYWVFGDYQVNYRRKPAPVVQQVNLKKTG